MPAAEVVAAFDFDGTLTRGDTLIPFLQRLCGTRAVMRAMAAQFGSLALAAAGMGERDDAKAVLLARLLAGHERARVEAVVARYTDRVTAKQLRPDVVARADWHRGQGHRLLIVSASPELYVRPVADALGFDDVLATRLETDDGGRLTGRLAGPNVRGEEKVRRIQAWLDGRAAVVWAYGNSSSDRPMLDMADTGVWVGRRRLSPAPGPPGAGPTTR
jgi:HAD superfamily hydrolase (TIGR01490 family)